MSKMIEAMTKQVIRNEILELLEEAGSIGVSDQVLTLSFQQVGQKDKKLILDALDYLCQKELAKKELIANARLGISKSIYFITAAGIDVLDGTKKVDGLGD